MGLIYQNAFITIAASEAPDSTHGLFFPREYSSLPAASIELPIMRNTHSSKDQHILGHYNIAIEWQQEPYVSPPHPNLTRLATRGWATQEWILSRRVIHFLDGYIFWACHSHAEDETGQPMFGYKLPEAGWGTEWGRVIEEHSRREFTFMKDRLISPEGIAREVSKTRAYETVPSETGEWIKSPACWEGTFKDNMPEHLLWNP